MAKFQFKSRVELEEHLQGKIGDAMDMTMEQIKNKLIKIIEKDIYDSVPDSPIYERTYDLADKNNWEIKWFQKYKGKQSVQIYFKDNCLTKPIPKGDTGLIWGDWETYTHGIAYEPIDQKTFLQIINLNKSAGNAMNFPTHVEGRKPFWDDFNTWVNKNFDKIFERNCKKVGIPVAKATIMKR